MVTGTRQVVAVVSWPVLVLLVPLGWGGGVSPAPSSRAIPAAQQPDAKALFASLCATCHGEGGGGDGPVAAALTPRPASFKDSTFQASRTDEQLAAAIAGGKPPLMPAFGQQLTLAQIRALVAQVRALGPPPRKR